MPEQKSAKPKGSPRSASKKGKKLGGLYYKVVMARALDRKKKRLAKREAYFAKRRAVREAVKIRITKKEKEGAGDQVIGTAS